MEDWVSISKNVSEVLGNFAKCTGEITIRVTDALSNFAKSEEFQRLIELLSSIPDDVQKTPFFQNCHNLKKVDLTYEEVEWLFDELEISSMEDARAVIHKYIDEDNAIHSYINDVMENNNLGNREKLLIILCHFERLIYSTLQREKKHRESASTMFKSELIKNNHGMDEENIYKTVLLAITNVVFANTDNFTNIDKRLPFRNNILHRGIVDYSDEEVNIVYKTLLIFVAHVIEMSGCLSTDN